MLTDIRQAQISFKTLFFKRFVCSCYLCVCVRLYEFMCGICVQEPVEAIREHWIPGTRVAGDCEPPHGCWGLNPSPLQGQ